jgi:hypothetical protein
LNLQKQYSPLRYYQYKNKKLGADSDKYKPGLCTRSLWRLTGSWIGPTEDLKRSPDSSSTKFAPIIILNLTDFEVEH